MGRWHRPRLRRWRGTGARGGISQTGAAHPHAGAESAARAWRWRRRHPGGLHSRLEIADQLSPRGVTAARLADRDHPQRHLRCFVRPVPPAGRGACRPAPGQRPAAQRRPAERRRAGGPLHAGRRARATGTPADCHHAVGILRRPDPRPDLFPAQPSARHGQEPYPPQPCPAAVPAGGGTWIILTTISLACWRSPNGRPPRRRLATWPAAPRAPRRLRRCNIPCSSLPSTPSTSSWKRPPATTGPPFTRPWGSPRPWPAIHSAVLRPVLRRVLRPRAPGPPPTPPRA